LVLHQSPALRLPNNIELSTLFVHEWNNQTLGVLPHE
jgi:hypothetical protein